jgi:hypothetical protein
MLELRGAERRLAARADLVKRADVPASVFSAKIPIGSSNYPQPHLRISTRA